MPRFPQPFLYVVGKGGVGRTTSAISIAIASAQAGERTLLVLPHAAREWISTSFGVKIGPEPTELGKNLFAVNIDPSKAMEEYGRMILRVPLLHKALFRNEIAKSFLGGVPGLSEWAILGKAYFHVFGNEAQPQGEFQRVVFDAPATGHGVAMLKVPLMLSRAVPAGGLRREAERAIERFQSRRGFGAIVVSQPSELPLQESQELIEQLESLDFPVRAVVINRVQDTLTLKMPKAEFQQLSTENEADKVLRERYEADRLLQKTREVFAGYETVELPLLFKDPLSPEDCEMFSQHFA